MSRAHLIMRFLDYTPEQIELAGRDAFNYQGVGNPHTLANVKTGEKVPKFKPFSTQSSTNFPGIGSGFAPLTWPDQQPTTPPRRFWTWVAA